MSPPSKRVFTTGAEIASQRPVKRGKNEPKAIPSLPALLEEVHADLHRPATAAATPYGMEFGLTELTPDMVAAASHPPPELPHANLDCNFLSAANVPSIVPVTDVSHVSVSQAAASAYGKPYALPSALPPPPVPGAVSVAEAAQTPPMEKLSHPPSSPLSSGSNKPPSASDHFSHAAVAKAQDAEQKRMADRAARNRESSRRAREKAKTRFRNLELDNIHLRQTIQTLRMQNEYLHAQVERVTALQQSCYVCRYSASGQDHAPSPHQSHPHPAGATFPATPGPAHAAVLPSHDMHSSAPPSMTHAPVFGS